MRADMFEILAVLTEAPRSATDIRATTRRAGGGSPLPLATFYRRLSEALDRGWIEGCLPVAEGGRGGPGRPGQVFRLTPTGRRAALAHAERTSRFIALLDAGAGEGR